MQFKRSRSVIHLISLHTLMLYQHRNFRAFRQFGETEETVYELEQLQNIRERATAFYSRLHMLLLRISEAQPVATYATLDLLARTIQEGQATDAAIAASLEEIRRNWSLP